MKKETFIKKVDGMSPAELEEYLDGLTYDSIYELWHDITGNVMKIMGDEKDTEKKLKKDLKVFYKMDIFARVMSDCFEAVSEEMKSGADA